MSKKTIKQKKDEIKPWRAKYGGRCTYCHGQITPGRDLVCYTKFGNVIHYTCHPDWVPAPAPGYEYSGRRKKDA